MDISPDAMKLWQERANAAWHTIQSRLSPFDAFVHERLSPYITVPDMPEGLLTALSIPVVMTALVILATLFDMFGTLLLRITFRYRSRRLFHPGMWAIYDPLSASLLPRYRLLPWVTLHDLIRLDNGSQYQRALHGRNLNAYHVDAVICDQKSGNPVQVIMLLPKGRPKRALKKRHRQIAKACKRAHIPVTYLAMQARTADAYPATLNKYLHHPKNTPAV